MRITEEAELLKFLLEKLENKSRNNIKSLLKYEQVLVNGKVVRQFNHVLKKGDYVEIKGSRSTDEIDVIYEDEDFLAINKPAGLLSVSTDNKPARNAFNLIENYCRSRNKHAKIFLLHRLDKDTSGIFIVTKSFEMQQVMQNSWNELVLDRSYVALISAKITPKEDTIISYLKENKEHMVYSAQDGKKAITHYKVIKQGSKYSLLDVKLATGRKNQIRVHLKERGYPVLGDCKYGGEKFKRLGLHAYRLVFRHPFTNKLIKINVEIPKIFFNV